MHVQQQVLCACEHSKGDFCVSESGRMHVCQCRLESCMQTSVCGRASACVQKSVRVRQLSHWHQSMMDAYIISQQQKGMICKASLGHCQHALSLQGC